MLPRPVARPSEGLETLPLINLVFLLLVFFLLAGSIRAPEALEVSPPTLDADAERQAEDATVLQLAADGRMAWGNELLPPERLDDWLRGRLAAGDVALSLRADAGADARETIALLHRLRAAGLEQVRLEVRTGSEPP